jgi:hypothetical protein
MGSGGRGMERTRARAGDHARTRLHAPTSPIIPDAPMSSSVASNIESSAVRVVSAWAWIKLAVTAKPHRACTPESRSSKMHERFELMRSSLSSLAEGISLKNLERSVGSGSLAIASKSRAAGRSLALTVAEGCDRQCLSIYSCVGGRRNGCCSMAVPLRQPSIRLQQGKRIPPVPRLIHTRKCPENVARVSLIRVSTEVMINCCIYMLLGFMLPSLKGIQ